MRDKFKKIVLGASLSIFSFIAVFGVLMIPTPALAFGNISSVTDPNFFQFLITQNKKAVKEPIQEKIKIAIMTAVMRTLTYFVQKVSYDLAVYAASGGKGQGALAQSQDFGSYMKNVGEHAFGQVIDSLGKPFGLNLCKPPDMSLELALRLGIKQAYCDPDTGSGGEGKGLCQPVCTYSQFKKNWSQVGGSQYWKQQGRNFNVSLKPSQTDFGFYVEGKARVDRLAAQTTKGVENQRKEDQGAKGAVNLISGNIKTPGAVMMDTYKQQSPASQAKQTRSDMGAALSSGISALPQFASSVFLNTFLSTVLKNFMDKGMLFGVCITSKCKTSGNGLNEAGVMTYEGYTLPGRAEAEAYYSNLLKINYGTIENFDLLSQFETCNETDNGLHNCVLDKLFASAIRSAQNGNYLTIGDALKPENGSLLKADWPLRSKEDSLSLKSDCYNSGYCYYNIKKLRQARVLPLGFEIAASMSDPSNPVTLGEVVKNFDNPLSKYYHLVDPNWLLKMPAVRCDMYAYGSQISGNDTNIRAQECVDLKSCVSENANGECDAYGYCTREGNVWKFDLTSCVPQYRTCKAFTDTSGNEAGYLYRTLDAKNCSAENAGCQAYSFDKEVVNGVSSTLKWSNENWKYFKKADSCLATAAGCSAFQLAGGADKIYLKKAGNLLNLNTASGEYNTNDCYNFTDKDGVKRSPINRVELLELKTYLEETGLNQVCDNYAKICLPEEEGCNMYSPLSFAGLDIPGKFTPAVVDNGEVTWNDQCDQSCVGYAAYREMPSNYSNGQDLEYLIPSTANSCNNVGCSAFTNLSATENQREKVEYFTYLRPCITPDLNKQKQYITYEGSETSGYRLTTYQLVAEKNSGIYRGGETGQIGAPKYFYRTPEDLIKYNNVCNEETYTGGANKTYTGGIYWDKDLSPDCRQFNDEQGNVYYRLLSKTIVASAQCTPYRLNSSEFYPEVNISQANCNGSVGRWDANDPNYTMQGGVCKVCFQNGEYRDGYCYYQGLPGSSPSSAGSSLTCSQSEDTCRAFKGNTGNNIEEISFDTFENSNSTDAINNWSLAANVSISNESTQSGGKSLKYNNIDGSRLYKNFNLTAGETYEITFWARGNVGSLNTILLRHNGDENNYVENLSLGNYGISENWQQYRFNMVKLKDTQATNNILQIIPKNQGVFFIDNIRIVKIQDYFNLIKKNLSVPLLCDSNPNDGLPGEALGCSSYKYQSAGFSKQIFLTNFSYLCREDAIGCTKVFDTNNLEEDKPLAFNVWLEAKESNATAAITLGNDKYSCIVGRGEKGCFINYKNNQIIENISGYTKEEILNASLTNVISDGIKIDGKDNPSGVYFSGYNAAPLYLVANQNAICNQVDVGCSAVGKVTTGVSGEKNIFEDLYLKVDNPAAYAGSLCKAQESGCRAFTDKDGGNYYFKDPKLTGNKVCVYKSEGIDYTGVNGNTSKISGWFWQNVGKCASASEASDLSKLANSNDFCSTDADCSNSKTCIKKGEWPCYSDYSSYSVNSGGYFGLWSYGMPQYQNFAGSCPIEQHNCTKFVDRNDKEQIASADEDNGQGYYYITDETYSKRTADCNGQVGVKQGCILLDKTDDPNKIYDTAKTYADSKKQESKLVKPISGSANDANVIIKAKADRACAEWLYEDSINGKGLKVCQKYSGGGESACAKDVSGSYEGAGMILTNRYKGDGAGEEFPESYIYKNYLNYRYRDTSWSGREYVGYSLFNDYLLSKTNIGSDLNGLQVYDLNKILNVSPELQTPENRKIASKVSKCRMYPTADSPFPRENIIQKNANDIFYKIAPFSNANIFADSLSGDVSAEDCGYKKITYGEGTLTRYYTLNSQVPEGACYDSSGDLNSNCLVDEDCCKSLNYFGDTCSSAKDKGLRCLLEDKQITYAEGRKGFCLESDYRTINNSTERACMTWLPSTQIAGTKITDSQFGNMEAFKPTISSNQDRYMCLYNEPLVQDVWKKFEYNESNSLTYKGYTLPLNRISVNYDIGGTTPTELKEFITDYSLVNKQPNAGYVYPNNYTSDNLMNPSINPLPIFKKISDSPDWTFDGSGNIFTLANKEVGYGHSFIVQPRFSCPLDKVVSLDWNGSCEDRTSFQIPSNKYIISEEERLMAEKAYLTSVSAAENYSQEDFSLNKRSGGNYISKVKRKNNNNDQDVNYAPYRYESVLSEEMLSSRHIYKWDIKRIDVYIDRGRDGYSPGLVMLNTADFLVPERYEKIYDNGNDVRLNKDSNFYYRFSKGTYQNYNWLGFAVRNTEIPKITTDDADVYNPFDALFGKGTKEPLLWNEIGNCKDYRSNSCPCKIADCYAPYDGTIANNKGEVAGASGLWQGAAVRAWFDENDQFLGFEYGMGDGGSGNPSPVSFFFVIQLNNGRCAKVAKIWDKDQGGKPYYFNLMLDANKDLNGNYNLHPLYLDESTSTEVGSAVEPYTFMGQKINYNIGFNYLKTAPPQFYGLVKENFVPSKVSSYTANNSTLTVDPYGFGLNSFVYSLDYLQNLWWNPASNPSGGSYNWSNKYNGGIPLTVNHGTKEYEDNTKNYKIGSCSSVASFVPAANNTYCETLLGKMYSKVYSTYSFNSSFNNWTLDENMPLSSNGREKIFRTSIANKNFHQIEYNKEYSKENYLLGKIKSFYTSPKVAGPKNSTCLNSTSGCTENDVVLNSFSLSTYGDIFGLDIIYPGKQMTNCLAGNTGEQCAKNSNYLGDALFATGNARVGISYYTWTSSQQLPIKTVRIDYDNLPSTALSDGEYNGDFPNHSFNCEDQSLGYWRDDIYSVKENQGGAGVISLAEKYKRIPIDPKDSCVDKNPLTSSDYYECSLNIKIMLKDQNGSATLSNLVPSYLYSGVGQKSKYHFAGVQIIDDTQKPNIGLVGNKIQINAWEAEKLGLVNDDLICVFIPRLQVIDNWNWCTEHNGSGSCLRTDGSKEGCFGITGDSNPECIWDNLKSWIYGNRIIMKPNLVTGESANASNNWNYLKDFSGNE